MSRSERVDAAAEGLAKFLGASWYAKNYEGDAEAALTASDALLRTDEAVERVAEDLADSEGEHWGWCGSAVKEKYRATVRTVTTALLGEGE